MLYNGAVWGGCGDAVGRQQQDYDA
jgi:hypothetical protein